MSLVARRRAIDPALLASAVRLAARGGVLHVNGSKSAIGIGALRTLSLGRLDVPADRARAVDSLSAIALEGDDGPPGTAPRCHAALPFRPDQPATGVIPSIQLSADGDGGAWVTVVAGRHDALDGLDRELDEILRDVEECRDDAVEILELDEDPTEQRYAHSVQLAVSAILTGSLRKIVLARGLELTTSLPLDPAAVLARMAEREPSCTLYALHATRGRLIGASPELLISRRGPMIQSHPLAGTIPMTEDGPDPSLLASSSKDLEEHRLVVDDLATRLRPLVSELDVPSQPSLVELRAVAHLGTTIEGTAVGSAAQWPHVLDLLAAIHPTPAIGGVPRHSALAEILALEGADRGVFGGAMGWFDAAGDGEWVLGIRGARLDGTTITMRAGAGIVAGSTPEGEVAETRVKLASILEAVAPGGGAALLAGR